MNELKLVSVNDRMPLHDGSYFCILDDDSKDVVAFEDCEFDPVYDEFNLEYRYVNYWVDGIK